MDDMISRQAVIRWVKTECNPYGKPTLDFESGKKVIEHLEQMPSVQPQQVTGKLNDCISRQQAIDALAKHEKSNGHNYTLFVDIVSECAEIIRDLPSVQPEIIRCKDCKFANSLKIGIVCRNMSRSVTENDFCSRAERRTDGSD